MLTKFISSAEKEGFKRQRSNQIIPKIKLGSKPSQPKLRKAQNRAGYDTSSDGGGKATAGTIKQDSSDD